MSGIKNIGRHAEYWLSPILLISRKSTFLWDRIMSSYMHETYDDIYILWQIYLHRVSEKMPLGIINLLTDN
jgi:hypothetical protein